MSVTISSRLRLKLLQVNIDLGGVHTFGVLVELGASGAPAHGLDLRHLQQQALGDQCRRDWTRRAIFPAAAAARSSACLR